MTSKCKTFFSTVFIFFCLLLSGCIHSYSTLNNDIMLAHNNIIEGKTTQKEVRKIYGNPSRSQLINNEGLDIFDFYDSSLFGSTKSYHVYVKYINGIVSKIDTIHQNY